MTYLLVFLEAKFSQKSDLVSAYQQIELEEDSKKYTTINAPKGLFHYNWLPFGISLATSIFQRVMKSLLGNLPGVLVYLNDILVSGTNHDDHLRNLNIILERLESAGLTLKKEKCVFALPLVEYLGHVIDRSGLHPSPQKVRAIKEALAPNNILELKSFIDLVNYYNKFLCNLSTLLSPFYRLLRKGVPGDGRKNKRSHLTRLKIYCSLRHYWYILTQRRN